MLRRAGDKLWEARLLNNRGVLRAFLGDWRASEADLVRAEQLYAELDLPLTRARVHHNLGFAAGRRGDVPAALEWFDRADEYLRTENIPRAARLDRSLRGPALGPARFERRGALPSRRWPSSSTGSSRPISRRRGSFSPRPRSSSTTSRWPATRRSARAVPSSASNGPVGGARALRAPARGLAWWRRVGDRCRGAPHGNCHSAPQGGRPRRSTLG